MEQLGVRNRQGKSRHEKEKLTSGAGSRTLCDCVVTSRKVGHITTDRSFSIGSLVPFRRSKVEFRFRASCHTFVGEQFWGRAVRASRDPMDPGRFLFAVKSRSRGDAARRVFPNSETVQTPTSPTAIARGLLADDHLPASPEKAVNSSLFPEDRLR